MWWFTHHFDTIITRHAVGTLYKHSAGAQRGLAHWIESAKRAETRATRLAQVEAALLGTAPLPWAKRYGARGRR